MIKDMITRKTRPWKLATILNTRIGPGGVSTRSQTSDVKFRKRDEDPTCMACHAEDYGEPPFRASNWKHKDPINWKLSKPFENPLQ